jgi:hypothetical protein
LAFLVLLKHAVISNPASFLPQCIFLTATSVADPGCLSRILIFTYPGSRFSDLGSQIPDPKTATKEKSEKKFVVIPFFVATNFTRLKIIMFLNCCRKKFGPTFKEL